MLPRVGLSIIAIIALALAACTTGAPAPTAMPAAPPSQTAIPSPMARPQQPASAPGQAPFEHMDELVRLADLAVLVRIGDVTALAETADKRGGRVWFHDARATAEQVIFGSPLETLTVRAALYVGPDTQHMLPTKAPPLERGERSLLFLTSRSSHFDLRGSTFETVGGGVLWGKFTIEDGQVSGLSPAAPPQPLERVTAWLRQARGALARPGSIAGEISGLGAGEKVTLRLVRMGPDENVERAETLDTWTEGNGPWHRDALPLRLGSYAVVPEASGYLPLPRYHAFTAPEEGIDWRYNSLDVELFRPQNTVERFGLPLCPRPGTPSPDLTPAVPSPQAAPTPTPPGPPAPLPDPGLPGPSVCYGGYDGVSFQMPRGVRGYVAGLPTGVTATVRIQRLPRDPALHYSISGPLPTPISGSLTTEQKLPPELTPLADIRALAPVETVATLEVSDGPWGLVDASLGGYPYLVTLEAPGRQAQPPGYQVVVFGGKAPGQVRGVDFTLRAASPAPSPPPSPPPTPTPTPIPSGALRSCSPEVKEVPCADGAEISRPYPYTLYTHCGIRWAYFNGRWWEASPPLDDGSGNPPRSWGNPSDTGTMELVNEGLARFISRAGHTRGREAEGDVAAEFRPLPAQTQEYPGRLCS